MADKNIMNEEMLDEVTGGTILPYRVKKGENLADVAKKYNVTVDQLRKWNNTGEDGGLTVGQLLKVKF